MKKLAYLLPVLALLAAGQASAHVSVNPKEVGIGKFQTFSVSVPSEREEATVEVRLVLPEGLGHVSPTVKPGWTVRLVEAPGSAEGEGQIQEIIWTGGRIPGHFRDDFTFSAQAPAQPSVLVWKAYQKYSNGAVVSWELGPNDVQPKNEQGESDFSEFGPYSSTSVIDDLAQAQAKNQPAQASSVMGSGIDALFLSMVAVALSVVAVFYARNAAGR